MKVSPQKNDLIIFEAKDGFKSHIPLKLVYKYRPMLAVRQKSAQQGQDWEKVQHSLSGETDGGPFYLMWPGDTNNEVGKNRWPFGTISLTFNSSIKIFGKLAPKGTNDPAIKNGFKLFAENCSCCHTFFQQGTASIGPPMEWIAENYPEDGSIADFIQNQPLESSMPPQDLTRKQSQDVEKYIRFQNGTLKYDEDQIVNSVVFGFR